MLPRCRADLLSGKPINIEFAGDDLNDLVYQSEKFKRYIDSLQIGGIEELKSDFATTKPELLVNLDRERANYEGITAAVSVMPSGQASLEKR